MHLKQYIILLILFPLGNHSFAQINFNWADTLEYVHVYARSVVEIDEIFYVSGIGVDDVDSSKYNVGSFLLKLDKEGNQIEFHALIDSTCAITTENHTHMLTQSMDGNLLTTGYLIDSIGVDPYLMKLNLEGEILFKKVLKSEFKNAFFELDVGCIELGNGDIITVTRCERDDYGVVKPTEICLYKFDAEGNFIWYKTIDDPSRRDFTGEMEVMENGNIVLFGGKNYGLTGNSARTHASLTEIDTSGKLIRQWLSPIEDSLNFSLTGVIADDGAYVFATGKHIYINEGRSLNDPMIMKVDADHKEVWKNILFNVQVDTAFSSRLTYRNIINLAHENAYVAVGHHHKGFPDAPDGNFSESYGRVVKIDDEGEFIWKRNHKFFSAEEVRYEWHTFFDVVETADGGFFACGEARALDNVPERQPQMAWFVKMDEFGCVVPGCQDFVDAIIEAAKPINFILYPNPTNDILNVYLNNNEENVEATIQIINANGRLEESFDTRLINDLNLMIDVSRLGSGFYFLKIIDEKNNFHFEKFTKI